LIVNVLSSVYGAAASWRRRWYAGNPARTYHLSRPVVSIGNLRAGGSGKTPVVAYIARLLLERGEHPAILTRGYGRRRQPEGVTVVSDGHRVCAEFDTSGDEPLMLARQLAGVPVLVGGDRFRSGQLAEQQFGTTVHLLDDGFQHVRLARTVDLVLADESDLHDRVLPAGRLREPLANASIADAVLVPTSDSLVASEIGRTLGVATIFRVTRTLAAPRTSDGGTLAVDPGLRVLAFAGIAKADRFFVDLARAGWTLSETIAFRDHHMYAQRDIDRIAARARATNATVVMTTEKDAVRLSGLTLAGLTLAVVPLSVTIEPAASFADWLVDRIRASRS
jgi:tetraacyldisaccharide 4'-kinase